MIGRDFAKDSNTPGRALIQFDNYFAWLEGSSVTILRPGGLPLLGEYHAATGGLAIGTQQPSPEQVQTAMAHVILPSLLYREQRYRLQK